MDLRRRRLFKIAALALALLVLAFVVSRGGAPPRPAATAPGVSASTLPDAASPAAGVSGEPRFGIIGPATKADPHTVKRAAQSLIEPAPDAAPPQAAPPGTP